MIARLVAHDVRWLGATPHVLATAALTGFVVTLVGLVALHDLSERVLAASAILWTVATLAGLIAAGRLLAADAQAGGLRALLLAPIDRRDLFFARAVTIILLVLVVTILAWAVVAALFADLVRLRSAVLLPTVLVGAFGLGVIGALTGWAALSARTGEALGPILGVPLSVPLVVSCLHASEHALVTGAAWSPSLTFATGYAMAIAGVAALVTEHVVEVA